MSEMTMPALGTGTTQDRGITGWGARAAIAAPVVGLFAVVVGAPLYADDLAEVAGTQRFTLTAALSLVVLVALVFALVAIHRAQERRLSRVGHAGFAIALAGTVLAAGGAWDSLFTVPFLSEEAPRVLEAGSSGSLLAGYVISYLALALGWAMFASASLRARVLPRAAAVVMLVGAVLAILPMPTALRLLPLAIGAALAGRAILRAD